MKYNRHFGGRFISDYRLPVQLTTDNGKTLPMWYDKMSAVPVGERISDFPQHINELRRDKLVTVPSMYYAIVYKLFRGIELNEFDYHFDYEGVDCKFMENFSIKIFADKKEN